MSCERFGTAISEHACGGPITAAAATHLATCVNCRKKLEAERRLLAEAEGDLRQALTLTASPDLPARVFEQVQRSPSSSSVWTFTGMPRAALAAAAILAVGFGIVLAVAWRQEELHRERVEAGFTNLPAERHQDIETASSTAASLKSPPNAAARGPVSSARRRPIRSIPAGPSVPAGREPEVLVPADQQRAIARLRELLRSGAIDGHSMTPDGSDAPALAALVVSPLVIPEITVPEVNTEEGASGIIEPGRDPR